MEFIHTLKDEDEICKNNEKQNRENSPQINYLNKINDKPWGKEYLAYQNDKIGIWILHVNKNHETSLHCHFKKDTILINIYGCFKINLFKDFKILNELDSLYVPRNTFHGIHSYLDDGILMEIEVYTEQICYTDKNDLLRIKDFYQRDKNNYETSVVERQPHENEILDFAHNKKYKITNSLIEIIETNSTKTLLHDKIILLEGIIYETARKTPGSFIDIVKPHSFLTENATFLCLSNLNYSYSSKIIYSTYHLNDYLSLKKNLGRIGMTSGCFDILHEGHITNLKKCKKQCDHLMVCLSSDEQIKRLKGENRPINNIQDRLGMLIHFDFVNTIILYDETNDKYESELDRVINIVNPDIWFKGGDYSEEEILLKHPGLKQIELIEFLEGKSTTNLINKMTLKSEI